MYAHMYMSNYICIPDALRANPPPRFFKISENLLGMGWAERRSWGGLWRSGEFRKVWGRSGASWGGSMWLQGGLDGPWKRSFSFVWRVNLSMVS